MNPKHFNEPGGNLIKMQEKMVRSNLTRVQQNEYVQSTVKNVKAYININTTGQWKLPAKAEVPLRAMDRSELYLLPELGHEDVSYYQSLISILCWIVELGQVDFCLEVSMMLSHLTLPHEGHLDQVFEIFAYPCDLTINDAAFERRDWASSEFWHIHGKEELSRKMPEPCGMGLQFIQRSMLTMIPTW